MKVYWQDSTFQTEIYDPQIHRHLVHRFQYYLEIDVLVAGGWNNGYCELRVCARDLGVTDNIKPTAAGKASNALIFCWKDYRIHTSEELKPIICSALQLEDGCA